MRKSASEVEHGQASAVASAQRRVAAYYSRKVRRHGATPAGVDWCGSIAQELRFAMLLRVCDFSAPFSLNDVGCGYGALLGHLARRHVAAEIDYLGSDLSAAMVRSAKERWRGVPRTGFVQDGATPRMADYAVASGIFNVVPAGADRCWELLIAQTLAQLRAGCRRGFAVNFLAPAPEDTAGAHPATSEAPRLYRTGPSRWISFCENELGMSVGLVARYGLNEFTLLLHS